jgi:hypothetical protein
MNPTLIHDFGLYFVVQIQFQFDGTFLVLKFPLITMNFPRIMRLGTRKVLI